MKCPNCGLENPPSATVCKCGHNLTTGKSNLKKSLAEQAQEIREEVKKVKVDPDVLEEEISTIKVASGVPADIGEEPKPVKVEKERGKTPFFLSFSLALYSKLQLWPEITGLDSAEEASRQGVWAAVFLAGLFSAPHFPTTRSSKSSAKEVWSCICMYYGSISGVISRQASCFMGRRL
ncbi:hypothetical protein MYX82_09010 [Acidobacteria bacterium AH-259-D05]|nr:hypothetical protein [Acidobacteria bacterium AH-259-D05]